MPLHEGHPPSLSFSSLLGGFRSKALSQRCPQYENFMTSSGCSMDGPLQKRKRRNGTEGSTILKRLWGRNMLSFPGFGDLQWHEAWHKICSDSVFRVFPDLLWIWFWKFSGPQKGPAERGHVKNRQKVSKVFSALFDIFHAGQKTSKIVKIRDAETTMLIQFAFWRGLGRGKFTENCPKTLFFLGNSMTMKFGSFANFIVRDLLSFGRLLYIILKIFFDTFEQQLSRHQFSCPF